MRRPPAAVSAPVPAPPLPDIGHADFEKRVVARALESVDWLEKLVAVAHVVASEGLEVEDVSAILRLIVAALPDEARMVTASVELSDIDPVCRQMVLFAEECAANHLWDEARATYLECLELYPLDHRIWFRLGAAFKGLDRPYDAEVAWREARLLGAHDPSIKRELERLPDTPLGATARMSSPSTRSFLDAPLRAGQARDLARLLFNDDAEAKYVAKLMRQPDARAALMQAFEDQEFAQRNRQLLELIAARWNR